MELQKNEEHNFSESLFTDNSSQSSTIETLPQVPHQPPELPLGPFQQHDLFSPHVKELHIQIWLHSLRNLVFMSVCVLAILSVFWGSMYGRGDRVHNLNVWIINYDSNPNSFVGPMFLNYIESLGYPKNYLGYQIIDPSSYDGDLTTVAHDTIEEKAWGFITIAPNASSYLVENLQFPQHDFNSSNLITFWYPEARMETVYRDIVVPQINNISTAFTFTFRQYWLDHINSTLNLSQRTTIVETNVDIIANPIDITVINLIPFTGNISSAILTTGLIFLIIVSFFQIPFFAPVHQIMLGKVKFLQYMVYRPFINYVSVLFLSLAFSLVSLAFQGDFTVKFGRAGFVVYWMINFLAMNALGGASENVGTIIFNVYPQAIGFWLIFWVCSNSSTSFAPLELLPEVYKVGKALPVHNAQMAIRTILFGTKNQLGLNVGVFFGWVGVNYLISFPCMIFVKKYKTFQAKKVAAVATANAIETSNLEKF
ncbi:uncharacterized protein SAPINGB_P002116 [Magnusiomyces paraingens]|uniref:DUF3533 domain-containing protein n=1 Tax=Magnusiomyces paraingens TaxID=2606893 RepID=A0A5E8BHX1_9ASCO|nr:uncharacterized protein SAPINGB_P002116 [Saprochaete ingens]VVT49125.1 unnamed protein product [Saprochaete ingens]